MCHFRFLVHLVKLLSCSYQCINHRRMFLRPEHLRTCISYFFDFADYVFDRGWP